MCKCGDCPYIGARGVAPGFFVCNNAKSEVHAVMVNAPGCKQHPEWAITDRRAARREAAIASLSR
jgi:hypothetical protein